MLTDRYGRKFHYLRLSVTDVCNFRCEYCLPDGYQCETERDFLSLSEIASLVQGFAALGTSKVRITGGEPSLRKDLPDIIATCKATPGIDQVALTTNGFKLAEHVETWHAAGLTHVNVSVDSFDPRLFEAITGHDKLKQIMLGVKKAQALGMVVKLNAVLLKEYNQHALGQFLNWLKHHSVSIRFIELMQTGDNRAYFERQHVSASSIQTQLVEQGWQLQEKGKTDGPALVYEHPDYMGKIGLIMPYGKEFCATCNRLRVSAHGNLHLCLFAEQGISLRDAINDPDPAVLTNALTRLLADKDASHWLQDGYTGATKHLAMLGG